MVRTSINHRVYLFCVTCVFIVGAWCSIGLSALSSITANHHSLDTLPVTIRIPSIQVEAPIVSVGLRDDGLMDAPKTAREAGWFSLGFVPGEQGNAVITGHLDTASGKPAVFAELWRVAPGDTVEIVRHDGTSRVFRVMKLHAYAPQEAPLAELFGSASGAYLNLITCNGAWDEAAQSYNQRLVVFTKEIPSAHP
jgi:LPXTG-site transpeptidase (sortase) family protein